MSKKLRRAGRAQSVRARLMARQLPHVSYPLLVDDPGEAEAALQETVKLARQTMLRHDPGTAEYQQAEADVAAAQAAVEACYVTVTLTALEPPQYEALIAAHPPTPEQAADKEHLTPYNIDTFRPALLAACSDVGMSAQEWDEFLSTRVAKGERQGLWVTCLAINESPRAAESIALPKGWTRTLS